MSLPEPMSRIDHKATSRRLVLLGLLGVFVVAGLFPFETVVVPEWRVRVVDEAGTPLRNAGVREVWKHYSVESRSHEQDLFTDDDGYVAFPQRTIRAPLATRIAGLAISKITLHGSSGPRGQLIILAPDYDTWTGGSYVPGLPLPGELVVRKVTY